MSYTGLVHWHAGVQDALSRPAVRRLERRPAPPVAWGRATGGAPSYGGLAGWYATVLTAAVPPVPTRATLPTARPSLPRAA